MKNWFKKSDPNSFAKTQGWYVDQIDKYLKNATPSRTRKKQQTGNNMNLMNKIEKGYDVSENMLKKMGKGKESGLGSTSIYNAYLIKTLCRFSDPFIQEKYNMFESANRKKEQKQSVYSRLKADNKKRDTDYKSNKKLLHVPSSQSVSKYLSSKSSY